jgi:hypothetical protein
MSARYTQHIVDVFAVLGQVREAARIDRQWCLLEGRGRAGRWRGFGNSFVYPIPNNLIGLVVDNCIE